MPVASWEEPELSPATIEASLERQMGEPPDELEQAGLDAAAAEVEPEAPAEPLEPAAQVEPTLPPERLSQLNALDAWLTEHPDVAQRLLAESQAPPEQPAVAPAASPSAPPPELDLDDPTVRYLYGQINEQGAALKAMLESQQAERQRQLTSGVQSGIARWRAGHPELTEDQVQLVRDNDTVGALFMSYNQQGMDPQSAVEKALDDGIYLVPSVRESVLARQTASVQTTAAEDAKRAGLWQGIGGKPARVGAPVDPKNMTNKQLQDSLSAEFRVAANGTPHTFD